MHSSLSGLPNPATNVLLCGDFNIPHATWPDGSPSTGSSSMEKEILECVSDLSNNHFLTQHITTPTHVDGGTLDLLFCNNNSIFHSYNILKPLRSTSDHYVVEVNTPLLLNINIQEEKPQFASPFDSLNFFSNDIEWDNITSTIERHTHSHEFANLPPNERLAKFMTILTDVLYISGLSNE